MIRQHGETAPGQLIDQDDRDMIEIVSKGLGISGVRATCEHGFPEYIFETTDADIPDEEAL